MKAPHLLRIDDPPDRFALLAAAARALGLRIGWLELAPPGEAPGPVPPALEAAADLGVLRAVAVGEGRTVAVKPLRGRPVLKDLLREHFRGCALVLVRGEIEAPELRIEGEIWTVALSGEALRQYAVEKLAEALRKPNPWG